MMLARKAGLRYVNRAEQTAYDYDQNTLTQDGVWHTLSLASIIPANAKLVLLRIGASRSIAGTYFRIAKVGFTNSYSCVNVATQVANVINEQTAIVDCTGQQIQYWLTSGAFVAVRLLVLGWFL